MSARGNQQGMFNGRVVAVRQLEGRFEVQHIADFYASMMRRKLFNGQFVANFYGYTARPTTLWGSTFT